MLTIWTESNFLFTKDVDPADRAAQRDPKRFVRTKAGQFQDVPDWVTGTNVYKMHVGSGIKVVSPGSSIQVPEDVDDIKAKLEQATARIAELEKTNVDTSPEVGATETTGKKAKKQPDTTASEVGATETTGA